MYVSVSGQEFCMLTWAGDIVRLLPYRRVSPTPGALGG